jgi:hypothetical protein
MSMTLLQKRTEHGRSYTPTQVQAVLDMLLSIDVIDKEVYQLALENRNISANFEMHFENLSDRQCSMIEAEIDDRAESTQRQARRRESVN